jgi:hypothetical protein
MLEPSPSLAPSDPRTLTYRPHSEDGLTMLRSQLNASIIFPLLIQNKLLEQHTANESTSVKNIFQENA